MVQTIFYTEHIYLGKIAQKQKAGGLLQGVDLCLRIFSLLPRTLAAVFWPGGHPFLPYPHPHPPPPPPLTPLIFPSYRPILIEDIYNFVLGRMDGREGNEIVRNLKHEEKNFYLYVED
jgi:hypothetical protein